MILSKTQLAFYRLIALLDANLETTVYTNDEKLKSKLEKHYPDRNIKVINIDVPTSSTTTTTKNQSVNPNKTDL